MVCFFIKQKKITNEKYFTILRHSKVMQIKHKRGWRNLTLDVWIRDYLGFDWVMIINIINVGAYENEIVWEVAIESATFSKCKANKRRKSIQTIMRNMFFTNFTKIGFQMNGSPWSKTLFTSEEGEVLVYKVINGSQTKSLIRSYRSE